MLKRTLPLLAAALLSLVPGPAPAGELRLSGESRLEISRLLYNKKNILMFSSELGWTLRPGAVSGDGRYRVNAAGLRAEKEYSLKPAPGKLRVAAFGDSFVFGTDAGGAETWTERLSSAVPRLEALNFGVPAYGLDQALLRFRAEGRKYSPAAVIIGILPSTLHRNLNAFRPFWDPAAGMPFAKPRFSLSKDGLVHHPSPLPSLKAYRRLLDPDAAVPESLGRHDWFRNRPRGEDGAFCFEDDCAGFRLLKALIDAFVSEAGAAGARPLVIVFPDRPSFENAHPAYAPLNAFLAGRGYAFLDLLEPLKAAGLTPENTYSPTAHFTPEANALAAGLIAAKLETLFPELKAPR